MHETANFPTLIEREVRLKTLEHEIESLALYPEYREAVAPTVSKMLEQFNGISSYKIIGGRKTKKFRDVLNPSWEQLLGLMGIPSLGD